MTTTRWAALAGILFAITFVAGLMLVGPGPDTDSSDQEVIDWYSDSGNQKTYLLGVYVVMVAGLSSVVFVAVGLKPLMKRASRNDGDVALASVVQPAFTVMAAMLMVGAFALAAVGVQTMFDGSTRTPDAGVARFLPGLGYGAMLVGGGLSAAMAVAAASMHALRTKWLPTWLGWVGLACSVLLLGAIVFMPVVALPLWVLLVSVVLLMRGDKAGAAAGA